MVYCELSLSPVNVASWYSSTSSFIQHHITWELIKSNRRLIYNWHYITLHHKCTIHVLTKTSESPHKHYTSSPLNSGSVVSQKIDPVVCAFCESNERLAPQGQYLNCSDVAQQALSLPELVVWSMKTAHSQQLGMQNPWNYLNCSECLWVLSKWDDFRYDLEYRPSSNSIMNDTGPTGSIMCPCIHHFPAAKFHTNTDWPTEKERLWAVVSFVFFSAPA